MVKTMEQCQKRLYLQGNDDLGIAKPDCGGKLNRHTWTFTSRTSRAKCSEEISNQWCQQKVATAGCPWSVCCRCCDVEIDIQACREKKWRLCLWAGWWCMIHWVCVEPENCKRFAINLHLVVKLFSSTFLYGKVVKGVYRFRLGPYAKCFQGTAQPHRFPVSPFRPCCEAEIILGLLSVPWRFKKLWDSLCFFAVCVLNWEKKTQRFEGEKSKMQGLLWMMQVQLRVSCPYVVAFFFRGNQLRICLFLYNFPCQRDRHWFEYTKMKGELWFFWDCFSSFYLSTQIGKWYGRDVLFLFF